MNLILPKTDRPLLRKRVVVVGGGAGGSMLAKTLQDDADVVLIDAKEYFEVTWASLRAMVQPSFAKRTLINHREYLPNARIITSAATNITGSEVITAQGDRVEYDYLVIATGCVNSGGYTKYEKMRYYQEEHKKIESSHSILVIGGGPTGVELAAEIAFDFPDKRVILVHQGPRLLEFLGEKAGKLALDWLTLKGVEVILNQSVDLKSHSNGVYKTSNGEKITADCHFLCVGTHLSSSWLRETILKDKLDARGRLMVDSKLRVEGHSNIFAIGDITNIPEIKQGYLAHKHALLTAKNLRLLMSGQSEKRLSEYKPAQPTALVSLGRREGVVQLPFITFGGRLPGMLKSGDLFVGKTRKDLGLNPKE